MVADSLSEVQKLRKNGEEMPSNFGSKLDFRTIGSCSRRFFSDVWPPVSTSCQASSSLELGPSMWGEVGAARSLFQPKFSQPLSWTPWEGSPRVKHPPHVVSFHQFGGQAAEGGSAQC